MKTRFIGLLTLVLIATLGLSIPARAQRDPGEGIKVHGRWTIDVTNPDGSLAIHREFENELAGGEKSLAGLLGRVYSGSPRWQIHLLPSAGSPLPCRNFGSPAICFITEPGDANGFTTLRLEAPLDAGGLPAGTLQLSGSTTASFDSSLGRVETKVLVPGQFFFSFTAKNLATPIPVVAGQIIQVTVVFSFS